MNSKAGKIAIAASGVIAIGAALAYVWKKFIDVDDEEDEEVKTVVVWIDGCSFLGGEGWEEGGGERWSA